MTRATCRTEACPGRRASGVGQQRPRPLGLPRRDEGVRQSQPQASCPGGRPRTSALSSPTAEPASPRANRTAASSARVPFRSETKSSRRWSAEADCASSPRRRSHSMGTVERASQRRSRSARSSRPRSGSGSARVDGLAPAARKPLRRGPAGPGYPSAPRPHGARAPGPAALRSGWPPQARSGGSPRAPAWPAPRHRRCDRGAARREPERGRPGPGSGRRPALTGRANRPPPGPSPRAGWDPGRGCRPPPRAPAKNGGAASAPWPRRAPGRSPPWRWRSRPGPAATAPAARPALRWERPARRAPDRTGTLSSGRHRRSFPAGARGCAGQAPEPPTGRWPGARTCAPIRAR